MIKNKKSSFIRKWQVSAQEAGIRLLAFLRKKNEDASSVKSLKRAIEAKRCTINGRVETFSSHPLKEKDIVVLDYADDRPAKKTLTVLYEDSDLLIVDKPAGLVCENRYFAPLLKKRAALIHRLDKETSGVVMLGKNTEIIEQMIALFRQRAVDKQYLAIIDGCLSEPEGKIENTLRKKDSPIAGQVLYEVTKGRGDQAITYWKCLKKTEDASLVLCQPVTGRTHQLRIHLNSIGHPILGDIQYGKRFRCHFRPQRQLLHAYSLSFIHPQTKQEIKVESSPPADFQDALQELKLKNNEKNPTY
jgi:RluA family pseudouridine synthase